MTKRILLVDDERSIRESLSKILRAENYEVALADSGEEAIQKQRIERIDLLILDLNMPVKNGWVTLGSLVQSTPLLPIIIITGRPNQRVLAENGGADVLMEKPLDVPLLLQTIRNLLSEPLESRTERARSRASVSRREPDDEELSRETLLKRLTRPNRES